MKNQEWKKYSRAFKKALGLEFSPVAVNCLKEDSPGKKEKKFRICRAILDAGRGETIDISKKSNMCFGSGWHLGFYKPKDKKILDIVKKFVVEKERLFCSYEALDNLLRQMDDPLDNSGSVYSLAPMEKAKSAPQLVIFIVDAEAACRLLTLATFPDGIMPKVKIGGPACRLGITYPLVTGELNISFYDHTARKLSGIGRDKLIVSVPYSKIPQMIKDLDKCPAGRIDE